MGLSLRDLVNQLDSLDNELMHALPSKRESVAIRSALFRANWHICEGAPSLDNDKNNHLVGKLIGYLVTDFIKAKTEIIIG